MDLASLRQDYKKHSLDISDAAADPFTQFHQWFSEARAAEIIEPNAMILATADAAGQPSSRTVLLKALDARGFTFFSSYLSSKAAGRGLAARERRVRRERRERRDALRGHDNCGLRDAEQRARGTNAARHISGSGGASDGAASGWVHGIRFLRNGGGRVTPDGGCHLSGVFFPAGK